MTVEMVIPGLRDIADRLEQPGVIDKIPDDWLQITITILRAGPLLNQGTVK